jgi:PAS domain S-box-containing protein
VENGELRRIWGSTRDITSLRHAELAASALERRFREMLEGIQLPALMLDPQGRIAFCNDTFVRLTARSRPELTALTWMEGLVPAADVEAWKTAISRTPSQEAPTYHFEGEIVTADGSARLVQWDTICLRGADNQVAALAAVGRDLTYERALEAEIRRTQKLDGLGRLAAGIAHDFNNMLMIVMGQADQLLDHVTEADRAYGPLLEIIHAATHCSRLSERLLALGRKQLIKPQLVDINQLVDEIEALLRSMAGAGVVFKVERAPELPLVLADPTQMHEVLANLVTNARDAMPTGGRLTVSTDIVTVADQDPEYPGLKPGPYVKLSVSDTGFGLTEEVKAHIFEPFFTTKEPGKGTGLGLSTVYAIVKQSGGHITVRSVRGRGTTFEILLPAPPPVIH